MVHRAGEGIPQPDSGIRRTISQYAVLLEGAQYSVFVFQLYEKYIRASAASMQGVASGKIVEAIAKLADELHEKESLFQSRDPFICGRHRFVFSQLKSYLLIIKQQSCRYGQIPYRQLFLSLMEFSFAFSPFNSCFPLLPQTTCFLPETDRTPFHRSALGRQCRTECPQFSPFAAFTGYEEAIYKTGRLTMDCKRSATKASKSYPFRFLLSFKHIFIFLILLSSASLAAHFPIYSIPLPMPGVPSQRSTG